MGPEWFAELDRLCRQLTEHLISGSQQVVLGDLMSKLGQAGPSQGDMSLEACYRMLGLEPTAGWQEVQGRYRELAKRLHPDASSAATAHLFHIVTEAYRRIERQRQLQS